MVHSEAALCIPPMGTIGLPLSVLRSMPVDVWTSKRGFLDSKNAGLPQPVRARGVNVSQDCIASCKYDLLGHNGRCSCIQWKLTPDLPMHSPAHQTPDQIKQLRHRLQSALLQAARPQRLNSSWSLLLN